MNISDVLNKLADLTADMERAIETFQKDNGVLVESIGIENCLELNFHGAHPNHTARLTIDLASPFPRRGSIWANPKIPAAGQKWSVEHEDFPET